LYEKITAIKPLFFRPAQISIGKTCFTAGSILRHLRVADCATVWGSGIISCGDRFARPLQTFAVRGPNTRARMMQLGYDCPKVFGDPAILLPRFFSPSIGGNADVGIVPHYTDYNAIKARFLERPSIKVIDVGQPVEQVISDICGCEHILSSSLHGLIVGHAYGLHAVRIKSEAELHGDGVKFDDYANGVDIELECVRERLTGGESVAMLRRAARRQITPDVIRTGDNLIAACPFSS